MDAGRTAPRTPTPPGKMVSRRDLKGWVAVRQRRRRPLGVAATAVSLLLLLLLLQPMSVAAAPSIKWDRSVARNLFSVVADDAGNVYATGFRVDRTSRREDSSMVLFKFGPAGQQQWKRTWNPSRAWAEGRDLAIGDDGSVYLSGVMNPDGYEGNQWFIRKYSPDGALLWRRQTPNWRTPSLVGYAGSISGIAVGAGMLVASGYDFGCCGDVGGDGWVRAYDFDGTLRWTSPFEASQPAGTNDAANAIAIGALGRVYVVGWIATGAETDVDRADHETMVQKLGPSGGVVWTHVFFDHHRRDRDGATGVSVRGDRLMVTAEAGGNFRGRPSHAWLASLTFGGGVRWTRSWGTASARAAQPSSVSIDPRGSTYVAGTARDPSNDGTNAFVRKYSRSGHPAWKVVLRDGERFMNASDVFALSDGALATGWQTTEAYSSFSASGGWLWRLRG